MASWELLVVVIISTTPITLGALLQLARSPKLEKTMYNYIEFMITLIKDGELFLYCTSILGVVIFLTYKIWFQDKGRESESVGRNVKIITITFINLLAIGLLVVSMTFYSDGILDVKADKNFVFEVSKWAFAGSLVIYYVAIVIANAEPPDLEGTTRAGAERFVNRMEQHKL